MEASRQESERLRFFAPGDYDRLIEYATWLGWLHSSQQVNRGGKKSTVARLKYLHPASIYRRPPKLSEKQAYIKRHWQRLGEAAQGQGCAIPQPWAEILAYAKIAHIDEEVCQVLRDMSAAYAYQVNAQAERFPLEDKFSDLEIRMERGWQVEYNSERS